MRTLLEIHFAINLLITGFYIGDIWGWENEKMWLIRIWNILWKITFGWIVYVLLVIYVIFQETILKWLDANTYIVFWATFYLSKKWNNLKPEVLSALNNKLLYNADKKDTTIYRRWEYVVKKVNKRNNYHPTTNNNV